MATVSHLPHVLANVLVAQAAARAEPRSPSACPRSGRASATRPASPAPTRRSGPTSSPATARRSPTRSTPSSRACSEAAELIRARRPRGGRRLARRAPASDRRRAARGRARRRRRCTSCGSSVANRPGIVAELALALGRGRRQHRGHGALPGRRHDAPGRSRSGSPATSEAERAAELVARARPRGRAVVGGDERDDPLRPRRAAARRAAPAARQVDLPPRGADRRRWRTGRPGSAATSTPPTPARRWPRSRRVGAEVEERGPTATAASSSRSRASACAAPRPAEIDVGNAGTLLRLLPGLARGAAEGGSWTLDGDESIRRRPVDRIAEPLRRMGADARVPRRPPAAAARSRARRCAGSTTSCRSPAPRSSPACCSPACSPRARRRSSSRLPTRDHTERMLRRRRAPRSSATATARSRCSRAERLEPRRDRRSRRLLLGRLLHRRRAARPGQRGRARAASASTRPGPACSRSSSGWAPRSRSRRRARARRRAGRHDPASRARRAAAATEVGGAEVPLAIDELPLVALPPASPRARRSIRDAAELRRKESDRIATVAEALNALGGTSSRPRTGW